MFQRVWAWFLVLPRWQQIALVLGLIVVLVLVGDRSGYVTVPILDDRGVR